MLYNIIYPAVEQLPGKSGRARNNNNNIIIIAVRVPMGLSVNRYL